LLEPTYTLYRFARYHTKHPNIETLNIIEVRKSIMSRFPVQALLARFEPTVLKRLPCGDPLRGVQVRHLTHQVPEICLHITPRLERLSWIVWGKITSNRDQAPMEGIVFPYVPQETIEALFIRKIGHVSFKNVAPRVLCSELGIAHAKNHLIEHNIYYL